MAQNHRAKKYCRTDTSQLKSTVIIDVIKSSIIHDPFISLMKLKDLIKNVLKIDTSKELIRVAIKRLGFTKKKARFYGEPKYLPEQTQQFIIARNKYIEEKSNIISIDEVSFGRNGINAHGYSQRGVKLFVKKKNARMTTVSVVSACTKDSMIGSKKING